MPFNKMVEWLKKEKDCGIAEPDYAVLATVSPEGIPHSRVVAIREIQGDSLLFFTQKKTRKVADLANNPSACMNFFLVMQQRQISLEGIAEPISPEENEQFWQTLPRERQLRFSTYASTSGQALQSLDQLEKRKLDLTQQFADNPIPMSEYYCGFRFIPETLVFYTLGGIAFSEVIKYSREKNSWQQQLLSP